MANKKSRARIQLENSREMILKIFDYKCVRCGSPTREVHEIIPISHGKKALAGVNRVPLCGFPKEDSCHNWAHKRTKSSIPILQEMRRDFLRKKWESRVNRGRQL